MISRRNKPLKRRFLGDNPALRHLYILQHSLEPDLFERSATDRWLSETYGPESDLYAAWLRSKGIDPETGRMTEEGLAFFQRCLENEERDRPLKRRSRRGESRADL